MYLVTKQNKDMLGFQRDSGVRGEMMFFRKEYWFRGGFLGQKALAGYHKWHSQKDLSPVKSCETHTAEQAIIWLVICWLSLTLQAGNILKNKGLI